MKIEIPRGFAPGRAASTYGAAAGATPSPLQVAQPYNALAQGVTHGVGALMQFAEAAQADQALDDKLGAAQAAAEADTIARNLISGIDEAGTIEDEKGVHKISEWVNPADPTKGMYGVQQFQKQFDAAVQPMLKKLPKRQRQLAELAINNLLADHTAALQDGLIKRKGEERAASVSDVIGTAIADGNPDGARKVANNALEAGAISGDMRNAQMERISKESLLKGLNDFVAAPRTDDELAAFITGVDEIDDPYITQADKSSATSAAFSANERARVAHAKAVSDAQDANEVLMLQGIDHNRITPDAVFAAAKKNLISREFVGTALKLINDTSEGKSDTTTLRQQVLGIARAQSDMSVSAQIEFKRTQKTELFAAYERGDLSKGDFGHLNEQLTKLGSANYTTVDYKEAISRAAAIMGASVSPTLDPSDPNYTAAMIASAFGSDPKVGGQLMALKYALDKHLLDLPPEQQDPVDWVIGNVAGFMQTDSQAAAVDAITKSIAGGKAKYTDPDGHITADGAEKLKRDIASNPVLTDLERGAQIDKVNKLLAEQDAHARARGTTTTETAEA